MKKNKLVSILYFVFSVLFFSSLMFIIYQLGFEVFSDKSRVGNFVSNNHHSQGYNFPVDVSTSIPDSVVSYLSDNSKRGIRFYKNNSNLDVGQKKGESLEYKIVNKVVVWPELPERAFVVTDSLKSSFSIRYNQFTGIHSKGYITLNSEILWIKLGLGIRFYLGIATFIIVFYFFRNIFKDLRKSYNFSPGLIIKTKVVGIVLICSEIIRVILVFILSNRINYIEVVSRKNNLLFDTGIYIHINPRLDFNFFFFLLGLGLLVLGFLFSRAYELRQENDLTI